MPALSRRRATLFGPASPRGSDQANSRRAGAARLGLGGLAELLPRAASSTGTSNWRTRCVFVFSDRSSPLVVRTRAEWLMKASREIPVVQLQAEALAEPEACEETACGSRARGP